MEEYVIWFEGVTLWIDDKMFWDINVFRPSLKDKMGEYKKKKAYIRFDSKYVAGQLIKYPKVIFLDNELYVNIR